MIDRPLFVLTLRAERGIDGVRAVKALLKVALRIYGLRCIALRTDLANCGACRRLVPVNTLRDGECVDCSH